MNLSDVQALGTPMQCVGQVPERPPANVFIKGMNIRVDWATRPGEKPAMGSTTTTYVNGTTDWLVANISGPPWHYPNYPNPNCDYVMYMSNDYLDNDTLLSMLPVNLTCSHANFGDEAFRFPPKTCTYDEATTAPGS